MYKFGTNFRLMEGRIKADITFSGKRLWYYTGISCRPEAWDKEKQRVAKNRNALLGTRPIPYNAANSILAAIEAATQEYFLKCDIPDKEQLILALDVAAMKRKVKQINSVNDFWQSWEKYAREAQVSEGRKRHIRRVRNHWLRFQAEKKRPLNFENIDTATLKEFREYLSKHVGKNTVISILKLSRAFWGFCRKESPSLPNPWINGIIGTERYGTPYYLLPEEIKILEQFPAVNDMEIARDLFLFQLYTGLRISDLMRLEKENLQGAFLVYVPQKTRSERPQVIRVPLSEKALEIIQKYENPVSPHLLPRYSFQYFNRKLKELFRLAGLNRRVVIIEPRTGTETSKELYKVAASHIARRSFIGNLFGLVEVCRWI